MCGITGYWQLNKSFDHTVVKDMAAALTHRGPDDEGVWIDDSKGLALGCRNTQSINNNELSVCHIVPKCVSVFLCINFMELQSIAYITEYQ